MKLAGAVLFVIIGWWPTAARADDEPPTTDPITVPETVPVTVPDTIPPPPTTVYVPPATTPPTSSAPRPRARGVRVRLPDGHVVQTSPESAGLLPPGSTVLGSTTTTTEWGVFLSPNDPFAADAPPTTTTTMPREMAVAARVARGMHVAMSVWDWLAALLLVVLAVGCFTMAARRPRTHAD